MIFTSGKDVENFVYCNNCGHNNVYTASFCQSCGKHLNSHESIITEGGQASFHSWSERNKFDLFIKTNQSHYFYKWRFNNGTLEKWGFNWVALFFGIIWFGYRKMYGWMFGIFIIEALLTVIYYISMVNEFVIVTFITYISSPIIHLILAMFGNKMYYDHVQEKVRKIESQYATTTDFTNALRYNGGTSGLGIFVALVISTILYVCSFIVALIYAFTTTDFYDYPESYYYDDSYYYEDLYYYDRGYYY